MENKLICEFGIITDSQYADIDDCQVYGRTRYYRSSLNQVKKAISDWSKKKSHFKFVLQLGDIIEGFRGNKLNRVLHLNEILNEFSKLNKPVYHCWGNHEMYAFKLDYLAQSELNTARVLNQNLESNYYFLDITDKLRLICLNQYEISLYENDPVKLNEIKTQTDEITKIRETISKDLNEINFLNRFKAYNGAISKTQYDWLGDQLNECKLNNKKVILCGHIPLVVEASSYDGICWNAVEILNLIGSFKSVVVLYLAGHQHSGGYYYDKDLNLHHLTVNAILETSPDNFYNAYVNVKVFENKLIIKNLIRNQIITINI